MQDEFGVEISEGTRIAFKLGSEMVTGIVASIDEGSIMGREVRPGKMDVIVEAFLSWDPRGPKKLNKCYVLEAQPELETPPPPEANGAHVQ